MVGEIKVEGFGAMAAVREARGGPGRGGRMVLGGHRGLPQQ